MTELVPLPPATRIVDAVYESLRRSILEGKIEPGTQLSVPELSRRLEVSRSPIREAVLQLVANGLAIEQPRKGVVVVTISIEDLIEIHEVREYTEALTAHLAAERATQAEMKRLAEIVTEQALTVKRNDAEGYFRTNAAFHEGLGHASRNSRLLGIRKSLEGQMRIGLQRVSQDVGQRQRGLAEHKKILEAVTRRDGPRAEDLMRKHINKTRKNLISLQRAGRQPGALRTD